MTDFRQAFDKISTGLFERETEQSGSAAICTAVTDHILFFDDNAKAADQFFFCSCIALTQKVQNFCIELVS